jgi:hypothetical protein
VGSDRFNPRITTLASWLATEYSESEFLEALRARAEKELRRIADTHPEARDRRALAKWLGEVFDDRVPPASRGYSSDRLKLDAAGRLVADRAGFTSPEALLVVALAELASPDNVVRVKVCKRCKKPFISDSKRRPRLYCCRRPHRRTES